MVSTSSRASTSVEKTQKRRSKQTARKRVNNSKNTPQPLSKEVTPLLEVPVIEMDHDSQPFSTLSHKDEFRVIFANVDGLGNGPKMGQLKETTRNDHMLLLNETNYGEKDAQLLTANGLGCIAAIRALDNVTFKNGKRVEPTRKVKQSNGSYKNVKCRKKKWIWVGDNFEAGKGG